MARLRRLTDEPLDPPVPTLSDTSEPEEEQIKEESQPKKAAFVRMVTHVGQYPVGSVLPATHFEQLERLLSLGAVEYDHNAKQAAIVIPGGNPDNTDSISTATLMSPPRTPWMAATPEEVMGHMAMLDNHKGHQWVVDSPIPSHVVPNSSDTAIDTSDHSAGDDLTGTL